MSELLKIEGLSFDLPDGRPLLRGVSLSLESGRLVWISGPSGGGKTTLLRIMNRLENETGGRLEFQGRAYDDWPLPRLRRQVVLMPQTPVLVKGTVEDNLLLPFRLKAAPKKGPPARDRMEEVLHRLGLEGMGPERGVEGLSVGQRQRISLGRILLMRPALILMDEPLAALDDKSRRAVEEAVAGFTSAGGAAVMVSHISPERGLDRHLVLEGGRLRQAGEGGRC